MARNPTSRPEFAPFAALLDRHLRAGTRPQANNRTPWTNEEIAGFIPGLNTRNPDGTASSRSVANWRAGRSLPSPDAIEPILRALFGTLGSGDINPERVTLRAAYDAARLPEDRRILEAARPDPDAIDFVEAGVRLAPRPPAATDAEAAQDSAVARRHPNVVERLRDLLEAAGTRLDNQRAWRALTRRARAALDAAQGETAALPDRLIDLYDNTVSLGAYVQQDDALAADPGASDSPLDADIRRALADYLATAAPWLRSLPSVRAWDSERRDFLTRPELFEPVRRVLPSARRLIDAAEREGALSAEDANRARLPLETANIDGMLGEKAGYRGVATARSLLMRSTAVLAAFFSGAVSSDYATRSALVQHLGAFLARAEADALSLAADLPEDLRGAIRQILARSASDGFGEGVTAPAILPTRREAEPFPPLAPLARWREPVPGLPEEAWPDMVTLPAGRFLMGAPRDEEGSVGNEPPQRELTVPRPFALGRMAVTFAQWDEAVAAGFVPPKSPALPDDQGWGRSRRPVINVSWHDARDYCGWLNHRLGLRADTYRLPSDAEWEYACRAGTVTPFSFGNTITTKQVNHRPFIYDGTENNRGFVAYGDAGRGDFRSRTVPVGSLPANGWGLHEMHGNVWEWCDDEYVHAWASTTSSGHLSPDAPALRVLRGGSWEINAWGCRSAQRYRLGSINRGVDVGFRLARSIV